MGETLRQTREAHGWELSDVATALRIRLAYLQALESGDLRQLPGNAYALGFLRTYATTLGLDADQITRRFRDETRDVNRKPELAFPAPVPERGIPAGALVLLGLVVIAGAYIGYYRLSDHERTPSQTVPAVPVALAPYANGSRPAMPPSPQVASVLPEGQQAAPPSALPARPAQPAPGQPAANPSVAPAPSAAPAPAQAATAPVATPAQPAAPAAQGQPGPQAAAQASPTRPDAPAAAAGPAAPAVPAPAPIPTAAPDQIALVAKATSWVQVRQDGKVIYDHILKAGDSWTAPASGGALTLTTGNAGGLAVSVGGVEGPVLGRPGAVRRNLSLDAAGIRAGALAPATAGAAGTSVPAPPAAGVAAPTPATSSVSGTTTPVPSVAHRHAPRPAPVEGGVSADDLNARQLGHTP